MEKRLDEMHDQMYKLMEGIQKVQDYNVDHQKLLIESERYRESAKRVLDEEQEELKEEEAAKIVDKEMQAEFST
jgi:hypothetical protein